MTTVTGLTAARMLEIEGASVVDARVEPDGDLILIQHDGTEINVGNVSGPSGPPGPVGPAGIAAIPGEVKLWPGSALPAVATYGKWVWADGAYYAVADYPIAAAHISAAWKTFDGASDPGAGNFRVPDLRGLVPAGLDQMPGGSRANRMSRAVAITLAAKTGKETHVLTMPEIARHAHGGAVVAGGEHYHYNPGDVLPWVSKAVAGWSTGFIGTLNAGPQGTHPYDAYNLLRVGGDGTHGHAIPAEGNDNAHENVQPTVMVPYIVCLDG